MGNLWRWLIMSGATFQLLLASGSLAQLTLLDNQGTNNVSEVSHTFSMNCGNGGDIVCGVEVAVSGTISSVTIGGVTATQRVVTSISPRVAIYTASGVPSGAQNVVITASTTATRFGAQLYSIAGQQSLAPASTASDVSHTTGAPAATLNVPVGGVALGVACEFSGTATASAWTGLTEDVDQTFSSGPGGVIYTSAHDSFPAGNASLSTSVTFSGGTVFGAVAVWAVWSAA